MLFHFLYLPQSNAKPTRKGNRPRQEIAKQREETIVNSFAKNILCLISDPSEEQINEIKNKIIEARRKERILQTYELLKSIQGKDLSLFSEEQIQEFQNLAEKESNIEQQLQTILANSTKESQIAAIQSLDKDTRCEIAQFILSNYEQHTKTDLEIIADSNKRLLGRIDDLNKKIDKILNQQQAPPQIFDISTDDDIDLNDSFNIFARSNSCPIPQINQTLAQEEDQDVVQRNEDLQNDVVDLQKKLDESNAELKTLRELTLKFPT